MQQLPSQPATDRLPGDIYSPFVVRSSAKARPHVFLPQVLWPHDPALHLDLFREEHRRRVSSKASIKYTSLAGKSSAGTKSAASSSPGTVSSGTTGSTLSTAGIGERRKGSGEKKAREESDHQQTKEKTPPRVPALLTYHPLTPYILQFPIATVLQPHDVLFYLESFFSTCLIDRTRILHRIHPVRPLDPIPLLLHTSHSSTEQTSPKQLQQKPTVSVEVLPPPPPLARLCDLRAQAILADAEAHDLDVRVIWDATPASTAALCALLRAADQEPQRKARIVVVHDGVAPLRSRPKFYRRFVRHAVRERAVTMARGASTLGTNPSPYGEQGRKQPPQQKNSGKQKYMQHHRLGGDHGSSDAADNGDNSGTGIGGRNKFADSQRSMSTIEYIGKGDHANIEAFPPKHTTNNLNHNGESKLPPRRPGAAAPSGANGQAAALGSTPPSSDSSGRPQALLVEDEAFRWAVGQRNFLVVTGDCARELLGGLPTGACDRARNALRAAARSPWRTTLPGVLERCGAIPDGAGPAWEAVFSRQVARAPVRVRSVADFVWWLGFSCAWQKACLGVVERRRKPSRDMMNRVVHFFRADEFQRWAMLRRVSPSATWDSGLEGTGGDVVDDERKMEMDNEHDAFIVNALHDWEAPLRDYIRETTGVDEAGHLIRPRIPQLIRSISRTGSMHDTAVGAKEAARTVSAAEKTGTDVMSLGLDENFEHVRFGRHAISLDYLREVYNYGDADALGQQTSELMSMSSAATSTVDADVGNTEGSGGGGRRRRKWKRIASRVGSIKNGDRDGDIDMGEGDETVGNGRSLSANTAPTGQSVPAYQHAQRAPLGSAQQASGSVWEAGKKSWRLSVAAKVVGERSGRLQRGSSWRSAAVTEPAANDGNAAMRQWAFTYGRRHPLGSRVKRLRSLVRTFALGGTSRR